MSAAIQPLTHPAPLRIDYAGVAFELLGPDAAALVLQRTYQPFVGPGPVPPVARVCCSVEVSEPGPRGSVPQAVVWSWKGGSALVDAGRCRAVVRELSRGHYASTATIEPGSEGTSALVSAVAAAVLEHCGGASLHAAGVALDGRAILFVGPSGAGKTTASGMVRGATWIGHDSVAVVKRPQGWYAHGLVGGSQPVPLPPSPSPAAPLGAVLWVEKDGTEPRVEWLSPHPAVSTLRRVMRTGSSCRAGQERSLGIAAELAREVPVGVVHTRLGEDLAPVLRRAMTDLEGACEA